MKLTFIADMHYYSKTLGTSGKAYELKCEKERQCLAETGDIIDSAFRQISESDTQTVFIIGDLTHCGETASHFEIREKLYELNKTKQVYVITGAYDRCGDKNSGKSDADSVYDNTDGMNSRDLSEFYYDFGPKQAIDRFITETGTICYTVQPGENLRVLCLNHDKNENRWADYAPDCRKWIEKQIKLAKKDGCLLIGMQHCLLIPHVSPLITGGSVYTENWETAASRFADLGLKYMFAGHSHIQATDTFTSKNGNTITEVNVGSLCSYPAPIVHVAVNEDNTLAYNVDHVKTFIHNGKETDALSFLAEYAAAFVHRIFECRTAAAFEERLSALQLDGRKFGKYWNIIRPVLQKLDHMKTYEAYKFLKVFGFAKGVSKEDAKEFSDKPLKEFVSEIWLSVLDGAMFPKDKNSTYYRLVMSVAAVPSKVFKNSKNMKKITEAADYALTGGEINNQHAVI